MSEVYYLSDIGAEATDLVQRYMTKFFPDAKEEMLAPKGLINTCKRKFELFPADAGRACSLNRAQRSPRKKAKRATRNRGYFEPPKRGRLDGYMGIYDCYRLQDVSFRSFAFVFIAANKQSA